MATSRAPAVDWTRQLPLEGLADARPTKASSATAASDAMQRVRAMVNAEAVAGRRRAEGLDANRGVRLATTQSG